MTDENKELFDSVEEVDNQEKVLEEEIEESTEEETRLKPILSSKSAKELEEERGNKEKRDGATLTIKSLEILPPRTKTLKDGVLVDVEPKTALTGTKLYPSKLKIRFAEDNLVEYYPGINFFLKEDGSVNSRIKLNRKGNNTVSKLVKLTLLSMSKEKGIEIKTTDLSKLEKDKTFVEFSKITSDAAVLDFLVGKKVEIKTTEGEYLGKAWFRNDIIAIVG